MDESQVEEDVLENEDGSEPVEGDAQAAQEASGPEVELDPLEQALLERDEAKASWMRAQADYQNLRRRTREDIDAAVARAKSEVLAEAVTVLDYLDMALAAPVDSEDAKNLKIGVEMTRGQLQGMFDRLAVQPIDASGTFDPAVHQAVSTVDTTEHEPGTIVEVVRSGWTMGDTVLRFAQVRVAAAPDAEGVEGAGAGAGAGDDSDAARDEPRDDEA